MQGMLHLFSNSADVLSKFVDCNLPTGAYTYQRSALLALCFCISVWRHSFADVMDWVCHVCTSLLHRAKPLSVCGRSQLVSDLAM